MLSAGNSNCKYATSLPLLKKLSYFFSKRSLGKGVRRLWRYKYL